MSDVTDRLDALERALKANQLPDTIAVLQRTLEQHWQPDASVLLPAGSIIGSMLGGVVDSDSKGFKIGGIHVRWGTVTITGTGTAVSSSTVSHGMGSVPVAVTGSNIDGFTTLLVTFDTLGATSFNANARDSRETAWSTARIFSWVAIG